MPDLLGARFANICLIGLAIASFPGACFSSFIAANSFKTTMPKINPFVSVGIGAAVSVVLAVTGWAGEVVKVFQVIGASFGPVCGAMLADYWLSGGKWSGPRAGFNPAGWISWIVGLAVGAFNLVVDMLLPTRVCRAAHAPSGRLEELRSGSAGGRDGGGIGVVPGAVADGRPHAGSWKCPRWPCKNLAAKLPAISEQPTGCDPRAFFLIRSKAAVCHTRRTGAIRAIHPLGRVFAPFAAASSPESAGAYHRALRRGELPEVRCYLHPAGSDISQVEMRNNREELPPPRVHGSGRKNRPGLVRPFGGRVCGAAVSQRPAPADPARGKQRGTVVASLPRRCARRHGPGGPVDWRPICAGRGSAVRAHGRPPS